MKKWNKNEKIYEWNNNFFVFSFFLIKIFGIVITSRVYGILGNVNNTRSQTDALLYSDRFPRSDPGTARQLFSGLHRQVKSLISVTIKALDWQGALVGRWRCRCMGNRGLFASTFLPSLPDVIAAKPSADCGQRGHTGGSPASENDEAEIDQNAPHVQSDCKPIIN